MTTRDRIKNFLAAAAAGTRITHPDLAARLGVSVQGVQIAVQQLLAAGVIRIVDRQTGLRTGNGTIYELLTPTSASTDARQ